MRIILVVALVAGCSQEYGYEQVSGTQVQKELCRTGCTTDVDRILETRSKFEQIGDRTFVTHDLDAAGDPCTALPQGRLCALVCDPEALQAAIPAGTCVDFSCTLLDGRELVAGACNASKI